MNKPQVPFIGQTCVCIHGVGRIQTIRHRDGKMVLGIWTYSGGYVREYDSDDVQVEVMNLAPCHNPKAVEDTVFTPKPPSAALRRRAA